MKRKDFDEKKGLEIISKIPKERLIYTGDLPVGSINASAITVRKSTTTEKTKKIGGENMKKKIVWIIVSYLVVYLLGVITIPTLRDKKEKTLQDSVIYTITVDAEYINLREEIDLTEDPIKKVYKGETFRVVEYYEGNSYNWYKVIYEENKTGWLASGKTQSWVKIESEVK